MSIPRHSWSRYVALGDSLSEGVGDPEPASPGGFRGWPDRVAEVLAAGQRHFEYANLALREKTTQQILDEQVDAAIALEPDLVTLCAGGNDLIRFGDPDAITARLERCLERLVAPGRTVVLFTGISAECSPVLRSVRGKMAICNENLRMLAARYDCPIADMWGLQELHDPRMWCEDRLHPNSLGHHLIARMVLRTLGVENSLIPLTPAPMQQQNWRNARAGDLRWLRSYLLPWMVRRIRGRAAETPISPKRPQAGPVSRRGVDFTLPYQKV